MAFLTRDDDLERTFPAGECLAVAAIGQEDHPVVEVGIELGQGEDRPVPVGRFDHEVKRDGFTPQVLAERQPGFLEDLKERDPFVPRVFPVMRLGRARLPGELEQIGKSQAKWSRHLAFDPKENRRRSRTCLRDGLVLGKGHGTTGPR